MKICSVSVDLDPLACYYGIHGLGSPPPQLRDVILRRALPRFAATFRRYGLSATFFVVGADLLEDPAGRASLGELARAGHELGNHSQNHRYELARLDAATIQEEVGRAHALIGEVAGAPPVGFRAPGYEVSKRLFDALEAHEYQYDSSIFPSWPYYFAKVAVITMMALWGRRSHSVIGDPRVLGASAQPYRPSRSPFCRGQRPLVELPIAVSPFLRLPAIGTLLLTASTRMRGLVLESMRARPFFNLELHGIDLIDAEEDGIPAALVARQPDLRIPLERKSRALSAILDRLAPDYRFATLAEVASEVQSKGSIRGE
jgi:hypothetical protein